MELLLLVLLVAITQPLPIQKDRYGSKNSEDALYPVRRVYRTVNDSSDPTHLRAYRNAGDKLKSSLEHLKMIARVTNGIYLQHALASGSIPADKLISELLHFGNVTPAQIAGIEMSKIQKSVRILKELPDKLKQANKEVTEVESTLSAMRKMIEQIDGVGDISKGPDDKKFDELLKKLENGVKVQLSADLEARKKPGISTFGSYDALRGTVDIPDIAAAAKLFEAGVLLKMINKSVPALKQMLPLWNVTEFKFKSASEIMALTMRIVSAVEVFETTYTNLSRTPEQWSAYSNFMNEFIRDIGLLTQSHAKVALVHDLLVARQSAKNRVSEFTAGLDDGPSDLMLIPVDLKDPWMKSVVESEQLAVALSGLKNLEVLAKKVDDTLKGSELGIDSLLENFELFNTLASESSKILTAITEAQSCLCGSSGYTYVDGINTLYTHLNKIDEMFEQLEELLRQLVEAVSAPGFAQMYADVIKICEEGKVAGTNAQSYVTQFRQYKDINKLTASVDLIIKLTDNITKVQNTTTIQKKAQDAKNDKDSLETYHNSLENYKDYFNCLQKSNLKSLIKAHTEIVRIREFNQTVVNSFDKGLEVVKTMTGTSDDLNRLKKSIEAVSGAKSMEIDGLGELLEQRKHSKIIGSAVHGISSMRNVLKHRYDVGDLVSKIDVVGQYRYKLKDPEDVKNLETLVKMTDATDKMLKSLDALESIITVPTSTVLADQAAIFEKVKMVTGVTGDYKKMQALVMKIESIVKIMSPQDKLNVKYVKESLVKMDELDLDFASYHSSFTASKVSLVILDEFFNRYFQIMNPSEEVELKSSSLLMFIGIALVTILVTILTVHLVLFFCKRDVFFKIYKCCRRTNPGASAITPSELFKKILCQLMSVLRKEGIDEDKLEQGFVNADWFMNGWISVFTNHNRCVKNDKIFLRKMSTEYRFDIPLIAENRVVLTGYGDRFTNDLYHANIFTLPNKKELVLAQGPQNSSEGKNSTIEKFWWLAKQTGATCIAMLCQLTEGGEVQCDEYYPDKAGESKQFGDLKVDCLDKKIMLDGRLEIRKLKGKFGTEDLFTTTHYSFNGYGKKSFPDFPDIYARFMKMVLNESAGTTIVHCSDGIRRTGTFAFTAYSISEISETGAFDMQSAMVAARNARAGCIMEYACYAFSMVTVIHILADGLTIDNEKVKNEFEVLQSKWQQMKVANGMEY